MAANSGEIKGAEAEWAEVDSDGRLHLPVKIASSVTWYRTGQACEVVLEFHKKGCLLIHGGSVWSEIEEQRKALEHEFAGEIAGKRRVALSHLVFRKASIGKSNRRIGLQAEVLQHLGVQKPARVVCLSYADKVEVLCEEAVGQELDSTRNDIVITQK
jgi:DNA-binding transcriptional regulator/RsmH inhibitor MraZ